jgi:hypothetical protein
MYLHKETGDKDTMRRGKYLKKLVNANVLGPHKSLLNRTSLDGVDTPLIESNDLAVKMM